MAKSIVKMYHLHNSSHRPGAVARPEVLASAKLAFWRVKSAMAICFVARSRATYGVVPSLK
jgi:hypothetical protein